jgi:hypothetical protein
MSKSSTVYVGLDVHKDSVPSSEIPGIHGPCSPGFLISTRVTAPRGTWDPAGKV